ncbi:MAG: NUDIX hydrolase [Promethearchaeota archaeon]
MENINILWTGLLPLDNIRWNQVRHQEFQLSSEYNSKIRNCWDKHIKENPNDYDGTLIFLDNFHFKDRLLFLDSSYMKFSTATFMVKNKIRIKKGIGLLGTQYLIFSPKKRYFLVGERALSQPYFPGATTIPGGILEISDLNKPPKEALMREFHEEVELPIKLETFLNAILEGWNGTSVTFLISTTIDDTYDFNPEETIPAEKDEWKNDLRWLSHEKLKRIPTNQLLDGLIFYQSIIIKNSIE